MLLIENLNLAHIFKNDKKYNLKASVSLSPEPILKGLEGRELRVEHLKVKLSRWFLDGISGYECRVGAAHRAAQSKNILRVYSVQHNRLGALEHV